MHVELVLRIQSPFKRTTTSDSLRSSTNLAPKILVPGLWSDIGVILNLPLSTNCPLILIFTFGGIFKSGLNDRGKQIQIVQLKVPILYLKRFVGSIIVVSLATLYPAARICVGRISEEAVFKAVISLFVRVYGAHSIHQISLPGFYKIISEDLYTTSSLDNSGILLDGNESLAALQ